MLEGQRHHGEEREDIQVMKEPGAVHKKAASVVNEVRRTVDPVEHLVVEGRAFWQSLQNDEVERDLQKERLVEHLGSHNEARWVVPPGIRA